MSELTAEDDWVFRVLGLSMGKGGSPADGSADAKPSKPINVQEIWNTAKETVDAKLNDLAKELRSYRDPQLDRIVEKGLFGMMQGGETVSMATAIRTYIESGPEKREDTTKALRKAIGKYRTGLGSSQVKMLDNNPVKINVALAATMEGALQQIEKSIGR